LRQLQQRFIDERRSFAVEDIHVDTQLLDQAKTAGYSQFAHAEHLWKRRESFSDEVPNTGDRQKPQHYWNVQKSTDSTDIRASCSYPVPAVRETGRPRIQKRAI
jgi:hypothetical protein